MKPVILNLIYFSFVYDMEFMDSEYKKLIHKFTNMTKYSNNYFPKAYYKN